MTSCPEDTLPPCCETHTLDDDDQDRVSRALGRAFVPPAPAEQPARAGSPARGALARPMLDLSLAREKSFPGLRRVPETGPHQ